MTDQYRRAISLGSALLAAAALAVSVLPPVHAAGVTGSQAYQQMTKFAGEWKGTMQTADGSPVSVIYKVTSAGKTVMETLGPGSDHEMVSMYHMDGPALVMTHYCSAGNQPHLRLNESKSSPKEFVFDFVGGTNLDVAKDSHIHGLVLRIRSDNQMEAEWTSYKDGKKAGVMLFLLSRKQ
jgi:hypothetical protein